ncbi:MAG: TraM recognition domain-containing protein [Caldilineales bacterium]|nr:TraM recognition domain-containing protein [Caldilineales bacterium]
MSLVPQRRTKSELQKDTFARLLTVYVPEHLRWDAGKAEGFCRSLFSAYDTISLRVDIEEGRLLWRILTTQDNVDVISNGIYTLYPEAKVEREQVNRHPDVGSRFFGFQLTQPFIIPLRPVSFFKSQSPMQFIVAALGNLVGTKRFSYVVYLEPIPDEIANAGRHLLVQSELHWPDYLTPHSAIRAVGKQVSGADMKPALPTTSLQKLAEEKAYSQLKLVRVGLLVRDALDEADVRPVQSCLKGLQAAFASLSYEGVNKLEMANHEDAIWLTALSAEEIACLWHLPNELITHLLVKWRESIFVQMPAIDTRLGEYITIGRSEDRFGVREVPVFYDDRNTHVNLVGKTRMGKSTLLFNMIEQDIRNGKGVGVIDPHGKLVDDILRTVIPRDREKDVILFRASDWDYPVGMNVFATDSPLAPSMRATHILSFIRRNFEDWSETRMEDTLYNALHALCCYPGATLQDVPRIFWNDRFRAEVLKHVDDLNMLEYWQDEYGSMSESYRRQLVQPIATRVRRFYRDTSMRHILCQQNSLNFRAMMDEGKIFLAHLGGLDDINVRLLGSLLITKVQMAGMSRDLDGSRNWRTFYMYVDEVQNFITTTLDQAFSEAAKYGLSFTVANQYLKQLEGKTLAAILGNVGTTIIFGVGDDDARTLNALVAPKLTARDLVNMNQYRTAVKMKVRGETISAFTAITEPPPPEPPDAEERVARITRMSRERYARPQAEVEEELKRSFQSTTPEPQAETDFEDFDFAG